MPFPAPRHGKLRVLAIGAHPDDIELGCGGALAAHRAHGDDVAMLVLTDGNGRPHPPGQRIREAEAAAELLGATLYWGGLEDRAIGGGQETVRVIDEVIEAVEPDVVYTLWGDDTHQDHVATNMASCAAARRVSRVLLYESPTSIGFLPTLFVDIGAFLETKLAAIRAHASQTRANQLVDLEAIESEARYRGFEARLPHGKAEGFAVARFVWDVGPAPVAVERRGDAWQEAVR